MGSSESNAELKRKAKVRCRGRYGQTPSTRLPGAASRARGAGAKSSLIFSGTAMFWLRPAALGEAETAGRGGLSVFFWLPGKLHTEVLVLLLC
jgi:hypothetical protein